MDYLEEGDLSSLQCDSAINVFKDSVETVRKQIGSWRNEQEKRESENSFLKDRLKNAERQLHDVQLKLTLKSQQKDDCDQEINKLKTFLEKANAENFRLCSDCCQLETRMQNQEDKVASLEKQLESDDFFIKEMKKETESSSAEKIELISMCKSLEDELKSKNEKITKMVIERENEQSAAKSKIAVLTTKLNEAIGTSNLHSEQLREQRKCCEILQDKLQLNQHEHVKAYAEMEKIANENKNKAKLMEQKATTLVHKVENLTKDLTKESSDRKSFEDMVSVFELNLEESCHNQEKLENQKESYMKLCESLKSKNNELNIHMNFKSEQFEASERQYKTMIEKIQQSLDETRMELKEKTKEISELQKEQLSKEYETRELRREKNEIEAALRLKKEAEEAHFKRIEELENQVRQLKHFEKHSNQNKGHAEERNADERCWLDHMLNRLDQSKSRYNENKQQQQVIQNHFFQVGQLQQQLRNKSEDYRVAKIEMQYIKEELERVKFKAIDEQRKRSLTDEGSYFDL